MHHLHKILDTPPENNGKFDIVIAQGLLHHLDDDEVMRLLRTAKALLIPGGRLITIDGCYVTGQSKIARFMLSMDRGQNVRTTEAYKALTTGIFQEVHSTIRHDMLQLPYTHIIMECTN